MDHIDVAEGWGGPTACGRSASAGAATRVGLTNPGGPKRQGALITSPVRDRFSGPGVIELAVLAQPGSARSMRVDQVTWVSVGARMPPVARRSNMNTVPIAAAATTRAMFRLATVTST